MVRILGTVCARGGSKGIPGKNIKLLNGKPLIEYTFDVIKKWNRCSRIICSSDSKKILDVARKNGIDVPFVRPDELSGDLVNKLDVLKHALKFVENEEGKKYDYIVDLDPTSPLRTIEDMRKAFYKFLLYNVDILYSVYRSNKNPYFTMVELDEYGIGHLCKEPNFRVSGRRVAPKVYSLNASIYIYKRDFLENIQSVVTGRNMIYKMSNISIDIDEEIDFKFIEFVLKNKLFEFDY